MTHSAPTRKRSFLSWVTAFEPAVVRTFVSILVQVGLIWGVNWSPFADQLTQSWDLLFPLLALAQGLWIRAAVTPASAVVQVVEPDGRVVAGPASPLPTGTPITKEF